jgi:hypothetical protein
MARQYTPGTCLRSTPLSIRESNNRRPLHLAPPMNEPRKEPTRRSNLHPDRAFDFLPLAGLNIDIIEYRLMV